MISQGGTENGAQTITISATDLLNTADVLYDVAVERGQQNKKWGERHHPNLSPDFLYHTSGYHVIADKWKRLNAARVKEGCIAWDGILLEEVYEALAEEGHEKLRAELVQVAAVAVAWIEDIDSREVQ